MKTYNDYAQLASDQNLKCGHVTGGNNGYPTPYLGAFIYGFDDYVQAEQFINENSGEIVLCKQKNGWDVWEQHGSMLPRTRPLTAEDYVEDLGDNYTLIDDYESAIDFISEFENPEDYKQELVNLDWEKQSVVFGNGSYEVVEKQMMSYHEDVTTWVVGVFFDRDAEPQD